MKFTGKINLYIYVNSLLTCKTMVGTPCNNFYIDSILKCVISKESEMKYEIRRVFSQVVLFFETLEPD